MSGGVVGAGSGSGGRPGRLPVVITGAGVVSPLGDEPADLFAALCRGDRALRPVEAFSVAELRAGSASSASSASGDGGGDEGAIPDLAGEIRDFDPGHYLGKMNFRPLDRTGRLATVAADLALADSGWSVEARQEHEVGLVLGTMFGSVHTISAFDRRALTAGPNYAKPMDFANSVINAAAGQTAIWHDLRGINTTLSGGTTAGLQALGYAADLVAGGYAGAVLAGGADELCMESFYGFSRAGWLAGTGNGASGNGAAGISTEPRPVPLDAGRNGFVPGEGAALLMLEPEGSAVARGARILGRVLGCGAAFDPSRSADAASAERAVSRAAALALDDAGLDASEVDCLSLSASGSVAGDAREARGLAAVFGHRLAELPAMAVKAQLGESLGASGAYQALAAVGALGEGRLPGVTGLDAVEVGLPCPSLSSYERPVTARTCLITALDFDGGAVAVVLAGGDTGS